MVQVVHDIIKKLLQSNDIFGENGVYYHDYISFVNRGITDLHPNQFYIRPNSFEAIPNSIKTIQGYDLSLMTAKYRSVFQFAKLNNPNATSISLAGQLQEMDYVDVTGIGSDKAAIYFSEYQKKDVPIHFELVAVDFTITKEIQFDCNCITLETC